MPRWSRAAQRKIASFRTGQPPPLKRWCEICQKETQRYYDRHIGHSRCVECDCHGRPAHLR